MYSLKKLTNSIRKIFSYKFFKRLMDIFFSIIVLFFGIPIFIIIITLIKFSSYGPIFFYQKRLGQNSRVFKCLKFRTMYPESEDILKNLLENNISIKEEFNSTHKIKNDPRITPIGKVLRKTSLDELPQFLNVLRGEMSIIGPRPVVKEEIKKYSSNINKLLSVKPGISGLWQVSGRNKLTYAKRVELDLLYVKQYNLIMDLRIIIRTIGVVLFPFDRGAY